MYRVFEPDLDRVRFIKIKSQDERLSDEIHTVYVPENGKAAYEEDGKLFYNYVPRLFGTAPSLRHRRLELIKSWEEFEKEPDMTKKHVATVGDLRSEIEHLKDDCEIHFSCEEGELYFCQVKTKGREDGTDRPTFISFELGLKNNES